MCWLDKQVGHYAWFFSSNGDEVPILSWVYMVWFHRLEFTLTVNSSQNSIDGLCRPLFCYNSDTMGLSYTVRMLSLNSGDIATLFQLFLPEWYCWKQCIWCAVFLHYTWQRNIKIASVSHFDLMDYIYKRSRRIAPVFSRLQCHITHFR